MTLALVINPEVTTTPPVACVVVLGMVSRAMLELNWLSATVPVKLAAETELAVLAIAAVAALPALAA